MWYNKLHKIAAAVGSVPRVGSNCFLTLRRLCRKTGKSDSDFFQISALALALGPGDMRYCLFPLSMA